MIKIGNLTYLRSIRIGDDQGEKDLKENNHRSTSILWFRPPHNRKMLSNIQLQLILTIEKKREN